MNIFAKLIIGIILLVVPLGLYIYEWLYSTYLTIPGTRIKLHLLSSLWTVLQGIIPPFLILLGIFIIWLELDEWRIERELKAEEKKAKKKKK